MKVLLYPHRFPHICHNLEGSNPHIPNILALNSDTHTLFLSILILNPQCTGVANEVIDIWYMEVIVGQSEVSISVHK